MHAGFSKNDTLTVKGTAILIMMWHHCFLAGRFEQYGILTWPLSYGTFTAIAGFFKICVSLFAFVSGYGLYLSFASRDRERDRLGVRWTLERYRKSFSGYWFIVVLAWAITFFIDRRPVTIYFGNGAIRGVVSMALDFLGAGQLFSTPLLCGTWWYMSAALMFIVLTPVFFPVLKKGGIPGAALCVLAVMLLPRLTVGYPGGTSFLSFLLAWLMGMLFARGKLFDRLGALVSDRGRAAYILLLAAVTAVCLIAYKFSWRYPTNRYWDVKWGLFPVFCILFIWLTFCRVPVISRVLGFFGKHSANIFMVHTFYRVYYLSDWVYRGHFLLVIVRLFGISLLTSLLLEAVKKALKGALSRERAPS